MILEHPDTIPGSSGQSWYLMISIPKKYHPSQEKIYEMPKVYEITEILRLKEMNLFTFRSIAQNVDCSKKLSAMSFPDVRNVELKASTPDTPSPPEYPQSSRMHGRHRTDSQPLPWHHTPLYPPKAP